MANADRAQFHKAEFERLAHMILINEQAFEVVGARDGVRLAR